MIFVTVGTQLPFERLIRGMDEWAQSNPGVQVFAQVGETAYRPRHLECTRKLSPAEYQRRFLDAALIVSHCGMGTIITGLDNAKPMVLMPRRHALGEHRNDHQLGTAAKFSHFGLIDIVNSIDEMRCAVDARLQHPGSDGAPPPVRTSPALIERLKAFVSPEAADGQ